MARARPARTVSRPKTAVGSIHPGLAGRAVRNRTATKRTRGPATTASADYPEGFALCCGRGPGEGKAHGSACVVFPAAAMRFWKTQKCKPAGSASPLPTPRGRSAYSWIQIQIDNPMRARTYVQHRGGASRANFR